VQLQQLRLAAQQTDGFLGQLAAKYGCEDHQSLPASRCVP
jgi:hypothetical protein